MKEARLLSQIFALAFLYLSYVYFILELFSLAFILFHFLLYLLIVSMINTLFIDPGAVPKTWSKFIEEQLSKDVDQEISFLKASNIGPENLRHISLINTDKQETEEAFEISRVQEPENSEEDLYMQAFQIVIEEKAYKYRFCKHCEGFKPSETHHCRVCKRCVLKLDHHNQILLKCIGIDNHKYYLLTLFYVSLSCGYMFSGFWNPGLTTISDENLIEFGLFCICLSISLALSTIYSLIFLFHFVLFITGNTMKEYYKGKKNKWKSFGGEFNRVRDYIRFWECLSPFKEKRAKSFRAFQEEIKKNFLGK